MEHEPDREYVLSHHHRYDGAIADWWCENCKTVTDFCKELNDFGQEVPLPNGFRENSTTSLVCPHRDLSVCDFCAGRYAEIVALESAHFWVSDAEERWILKQMFPR